MPSLTSKSFAQAIGVSESSVKRWADDGQLKAARTAGGHRRIEVNEAVRFIRRIGATLVHPDLLGMNDLAAADLPESVHRDPVDLLHQALEDGDGAQARAIVLSLYMAGWSPARIFDGPLRESLRRIGELWQHAEWGIVVEHRATDAAVTAINQLRTLSPARGASPPIAVGGCIGADPYQIPTLMAAAVLGDLGFLDINLGPSTPLRVLAAASERYRPRVVWMAASVALDSAAMGSTLSMARRLVDQGTLVVLGGRGFDGLERGVGEGIVLAKSMGELEAAAIGMLRADSLRSGAV